MRRGHRPLLVALVALFLGGWSFFDPFHELIEKGNRNAKEKKSDDALAQYDAAAREVPESPIPDFNRALVLAKEGRVEEAKQAFEMAQGASDPGIAADAHYNFGNLLLEKSDPKGAIEQYLRSLDLDPLDPDARRNLEIAMRRLEEQRKQQQQQQQQPQQQSSDSEQEQKDDAGSDDSEKNEDEAKDPSSPKQNENKPEPQQPDSSAADSSRASGEEEPQPASPSEALEGRLSREDAARLLNAIQSDELKVLKKLDEKQGQTSEVGSDW